MAVGTESQGLQGHIELFNFDSETSEAEQEEFSLTPQAEVTVETDVTIANTHAGSSGQRDGVADSTTESKSSETTEAVEIRALRISVSREAVTEAQNAEGATEGLIRVDVSSLFANIEPGTELEVELVRPGNAPSTEEGAPRQGQANTTANEGGEGERVTINDDGTFFIQIPSDIPPDGFEVTAVAGPEGFETPAELDSTEEPDALENEQITPEAAGREPVRDDETDTLTAADPEADAPPADTTADAPSLGARSARGLEDGEIDLSINARLVDRDGSERLTIEVSGIPDGAVLRVGGEPIAVESGVARLSPRDLNDLSITPPANSSDDFSLRVRATSTESNGGDTASSETSLDITVTGVADTPQVNVTAAIGDEDTSIALDIAATLADQDGSETLQVEVSNIPDGSILAANGVAIVVAEGTARLTPDQLEGLTITPPQDFAGQIDLAVRGISQEEDGSTSATAPQTLSVTVNDVIDRDLVSGTNRSETLRGGGENENIQAGQGNDTVFGNNGSDFIDGGSGNDRLFGGNDDDTLTGGQGRDQLDGGNGNDTFVLDGAQDAFDRLAGGRGTDRVVDADGGDIQLGSFARNNSVEIVDGGDDASKVVGTSGNNNLDFRNATFNNISEVEGGAGNDTIRATRGDDVVDGGTGNDFLSGEGGDDQIEGGQGNDRLFGGAGDDTLIGGQGRDQLDGGDGNDTLVLDGAQDAFDRLAGGRGTDRIVDADGGDIELGTFSSRNSIEIVDGGDEASKVVGTSGNNNLDFRNATFNNISEVEGGAGNDTIRATRGDDVVDGGTGNDFLSGEGGDDQIEGGQGNDRLFGGAGDDTLIGGQGRDQLDGGDGNDTLVLDGAQDAFDRLAGGRGTDRIVDADGGDIELGTFSSRNSVEIVDGGDEASKVVGTSGNNNLDFRNATFNNISEVEGGAGNDTIRATRGDDVVDGGTGNDFLSGEGGDDRLEGDQGNDRLFGGAGDDTLIGGQGRDQLDGGDGDDTLVLDGAQDAFDRLAGGRGTDRIVDADGGDIELGAFSNRNSVEIVDGGDEASKVVGTSGNNNLDFRNATFNNISEVDGGAGNDTIRGTRGGDVLNGGTGNDFLSGEGGDDRLIGGQGNDRLIGGVGDDTLIGGQGRDRLEGGDGDDTFVLSNADDAFDGLSGGRGTDRVVDADGGDIELGTFSSRNSIEVVDGGDEASRIVGTSSNNNLDFRNATFDNISEVDGGAGNDAIRGTRGGDVLDGGTGNDFLSGESGNDQLVGGQGNDRLIGGAGDDTLIGGEGRDRLEGGDGNDTFVLGDSQDAFDQLSGGSGTDRLVDAEGGDIELASFSNRNSIEVVDGGDEASRVVGTGDNNNLDFRNATFENISEVDGGAGRDTIRGSSGDDVFRGGQDNDFLTGENGNDQLFGDAGNDRLIGGAGNDTLAGGAGNDRLDGGEGDDLFIFGEGDGDDRVSGGAGWLDTVRLENDDGSAIDTGDFTLELDRGSIESEAEDYIALSKDASGTITMNDGSTVDFDGVDRIEW